MPWAHPCAALRANFHPHPAFDLSLLPPDVVEPSSSVQKGHYPTEYLNSLHVYPRLTTVESLTDFGGFLAMRIVYISSWVVAMSRPLWVVDTPDLNLFAFFARPRETFFLRRALLLEGDAWGHGLAITCAASLAIPTNFKWCSPCSGNFKATS